MYVRPNENIDHEDKAQWNSNTDEKDVTSCVLSGIVAQPYQA